jgi:hypothetical protein
VREKRIVKFVEALNTELESTLREEIHDAGPVQGFRKFSIIFILVSDKTGILGREKRFMLSGEKEFQTEVLMPQ